MVLVFARYGERYRYIPNSNSVSTENAIPCSVCLSENKVNSVMMPDRSDCPGDLHQEYTGVLAGTTSINCFDKDPVYQLKTVATSNSFVAVIHTDYHHPFSYSAKFGTEFSNMRIISPCVLCTSSPKQPKAVFTRFGRTSCPSGIPTLYTGYVGGRNYEHLCFPKRDFQKADFSHVSKGAHSRSTMLAGSLYFGSRRKISLKALNEMDRKKVTVMLLKDLTLE